MYKMGSLCLINIYWMLVRLFFVKSLFSNRFKINGRLYELITKKKWKLDKIKQLYKWIRLPNICLFIILLVMVPLFITLYSISVLNNEISQSVYFFIIGLILLLMIFILCYLLYLLPKAHHFEKCYFKTHAISLVIKLLAYSTMIVLLVRNIFKSESIQSAKVIQSSLYFVMTIVLSLIMEGNLMSRSKSLLQKSIASLVFDFSIQIVCYYVLIAQDETSDK